MNKALFIAVALLSGVSMSASTVAQVTNANRESVCDGPGGGADARCVGVVSPGSLTDVDGFRDYVRAQGHSSSTHAEYEVGTILPAAGVEYRDVPAQYGGRSVQYAIINGHTVLAERQSRRVVQVID